MPDGDRVFAGVCSRLRDGTAIFEICAQIDSAGVQDLSASARRMFPPSGEAEFHGVGTNEVEVGDWATFGVSEFGPPNRIKYRAVDLHPLMPLEDLSGLGDPERIRRLLVEDGRLQDSGGDRFVRISESELVQVGIAQAADGRWRIPNTADLWRLPVYRFDPGRALSLRHDAGWRVLMPPHPHPQQIGTTNWSSDADVIRRTIKSLRRTDPEEDASLRRFAAALEKYVDQLEAGSPLDVLRTREVLRFRALSELLCTEQDILAEYLEFLKADPDVKAATDARIDALANELFETRREEWHAALDREIADLRRQREAELATLIDDLTNERLAGIEQAAEARRNAIEAEVADLEHHAAERRADIEAELAGLKEAGRDHLTETLGRERAGLEADIAALDSHLESVNREIVTREAKRQELLDELDALSTRQAQAAALIEKLAAAAEAVGRDRSGSALLAMLPEAERPTTTAGKVPLSDVPKIASEIPLLSEKGRQTFIRFVILVLAGEIPLLHGPDADDFLEIAGAILAAGRIARLEADPTIIAVDDLWIRPGTRTRSVLRRAAEVASGVDGTVTLGVVSKAEVSGARFWYPALAEMGRKGEVPPPLLLCATIGDMESEEAKSISTSRIVLDMSNLMKSEANLIAPQVFKNWRDNPRELSLPPLPDVSDQVLSLLNAGNGGIGLRDTQRIARILAAASVISPADAHDLALAETRVISRSLNVAGAQTGNVLRLGGPQHA